MLMRTLILMCLSASFLLGGCAYDGPSKAASQPAKSQETVGSEYVIGIDDNIRIEVWRNQDLSAVVPVRPDGRISTPLIGDVPAAGLTPTRLAKNLEVELAKFIREPHVSVIVTGLNSKEYEFRVRVTGAVRQPISTPYRKGMTVLDLVLAAGGVTEFASPNKTKLHRKTGSKVQSYNVNLGSILNSGELSTNYELAPGDIVTIPERIF